MKFKVFTKNKEVREKEIYFRLVEGCDKITLAACDENGNILPTGYILDIIPGDGICLRGGVSVEIDLPLDRYRKVKVRRARKEGLK